MSPSHRGFLQGCSDAVPTCGASGYCGDGDYLPDSCYWNLGVCHGKEHLGKDVWMTDICHLSIYGVFSGMPLRFICSSHG